MDFVTTPRLVLRTLEKNDLARMAELIGDWDVMKWLVVPPYPYTAAAAEDFHARMHEAFKSGAPECFAMADKATGLLMGIVGLHPDKYASRKKAQREIGYWLGKAFWGHGYMSEAVAEVVRIGFDMPSLDTITSTTDPANAASQNVLRKAGFRYLGIRPRDTSGFPRGSAEATFWELTRAEYEAERRAS